MAFAFLSGNAAASANQSTAVTAATNTNTATLLVGVIGSTGGTSGLTISDSKTNTWTRIGTATDGSANQNRLQIFVVRNPTTDAAQTFTASGGGGSFPSIAVLAFTGTISGPVQQDTVVVFSPSDSPSSRGIGLPTLTPTDSNELLVAAWQFETDPGVITYPTGFTDRQDVTPTANSSGLAMTTQIQTTPTSRAPLMTWANSVRGVAAMAEFRVVPGTTSDDPSARGDENTQMRFFLQNWFAENNQDISSHRNRFSRLNTATSPAGGVSDIANEYTLLVRAARGLTS